MEKTLQFNSVSKVIYQGANQERLQESKDLNGFNSDEWVTFLQAQQKGLRIKEGAHGIKLVKYIEETKKKNNKTSVEVAVRSFVVFNLDQTEVVKKTKEDVEELDLIIEHNKIVGKYNKN